MSKELSRREFLKKAAAASLLVSMSPFVKSLANNSYPKQDFYKIVIKNGKVLSNGIWLDQYVGITDDGKIKLSVTPIVGEQEIDATGKIVSPGFIDILADNSSNPYTTFSVFEEYKLTDGVTTSLQMHGGYHKVNEYYDTLGAKQHYTNYGISTKVMNVRLANNSLSARYREVEKCLNEGALGVSHSIEYQPTPYSELVEYAKLAKKYSRPYFLHLRYSSKEKEIDGVIEAIRLAKDTGVHVHIDHLNSTGGTFNMPKALEIIVKARQEGLSITTCVYPYSYWATYLHSTRFADGWREMYNLDYTDLMLVGSGERLTQESFNKYRSQPGRLVAVPDGTVPLDKTVDLALQHDFCMIGSDGGIETSAKANNHPRGAGCFATAVRHGLRIGLPLEKILEKMTSLPQSLVAGAMPNRGKIADGYFADITIFDKDKIDGAANPANPNLYSKGIDTVIVNGIISYQNGVLISKNGKAIRYDSIK